MAIDTPHPLYDSRSEDWEIVRDFKAGTRVVKARDDGQKYLKPTQGMEARGMSTGEKGLLEYEAYKHRAVVPGIVGDAINAMVGIMHRKEAVIEVPNAMDELLGNLTQQGESAQALLRTISDEVLTTGRFGLLVDVEDGVNTEPFLATYNAESILNWSDIVPGRRFETDFVILNESRFQADAEFNWNYVRIYRVLQRDEGGTYFTWTQSDGSPGEPIIPSIGNTTLDKIPFVFIGSQDLTPTPNKAPLVSLADQAATIYRGEADYRLTLFLQGQDTLVVKGLKTEDTPYVGAGAFLTVDLESGDAKYIGVSSDGLAEQRSALENDYKRAAEMGAQMLATTGREAESGEALRIRVASRTASLANIAMTAAAGLEDALKIIAEWKGLNPEDVSVTPNLDFADDPLVARELLELMQAKAMGAPLSIQSIHDLLREKEMTELDFDDEMALIEEEDPLSGGASNDNSSGNNAPDDDGDPEDPDAVA